MPRLQTRLLAHQGLLMLAVLSAQAGTAMAAPLQMLVFPNPGLFDIAQDGQVQGPGGRLLTHIRQAGGPPFAVRSLPIPRALATGQSQPNHCLVGILRTPEREPHFAWVGPISSGAMVIYSRADDTPPVRDLTELRDRRVVVQRDSAAAQMLAQQGQAPQQVSATLTALRMLQAGRVDYWLVHDLSAAPTIRATGGPALKLQLTLHQAQGFIACHPQTDAAALQQLRLAVHKLQQRGDLAEFGLR